jgi:hypothetical protein
MSDSDPDNPFDGLRFDDFEEFKAWMKRGGREEMERARAEEKALKRQKIKAGEVDLATLARRLLRHARRLYKYAEMDAPYVIKDSQAASALEAAERCTLHRKSNSPDYDPHD